MTNLEMLCWGVQHIADNHKFRAVIDFKENNCACVMGGSNLPTYADMQMLCEDLGIDSRTCLDEEPGFAIGIFPTDDWLNSKGNKEYVKGLEFWRANQ